MKTLKRYFLIFKNNFNSIMLYPLAIAIAVLMSRGIPVFWRWFFLILAFVIAISMQIDYFKREKEK